MQVCARVGALHYLRPKLNGRSTMIIKQKIKITAGDVTFNQRYTFHSSRFTFLVRLCRTRKNPFMRNEPNFKTPRKPVTLDMTKTYNDNQPEKRRKKRTQNGQKTNKNRKKTTQNEQISAKKTSCRYLKLSLQYCRTYIAGILRNVL